MAAIPPPLRFHDRQLGLDRVRIAGIVNLTPDSFSDGGRLSEPGSPRAHMERLLAEGADILDLGAESTRPGATPIDIETEQARLLPAVRTAVALGAIVSVDTRHSETAHAALELGAHMVNDVTGLRDAAMVDVCARHRAPAVIMHMPIADPAVMQQHAVYDDVVATVTAFLTAQSASALARGVPQVIVDPGFGFGKTAEQNIALVARLDRLVELGHPVLVGASRKRTIGDLTGVERRDQRVVGSVAMHLAAAAHGAHLIRVHDVAAHRQALAVWESVERSGH
ncbi:MAG: dihydropteroate synthase [Acidimicrobiia bacterium]